MPSASVWQPGCLPKEARGFAPPPHDGFAFLAEHQGPKEVRPRDMQRAGLIRPRALVLANAGSMTVKGGPAHDPYALFLGKP